MSDRGRARTSGCRQPHFVFYRSKVVKDILYDDQKPSLQPLTFNCVESPVTMENGVHKASSGRPNYSLKV